MILASSAPGIFGGDCFEQNILVESGARVRLTSQAALQIHPSPDGALSELASRYQVDDRAELICDWDPAIPFALARFVQRIDVRLATTARVLWSDAFMAGRTSHQSESSGDGGEDRDCGERWAFTELAHELGVRRDGSLEYLERYRLRPCEQALDRDWIASTASHVGTVVSSGWAVDAAAIADLHTDLSSLSQVRAAVDRLEEQLALVRLIGVGGASFHRARFRAVSSLRRLSNQNR
jgi:urease accessory protein UreH